MHGVGRGGMGRSLPDEDEAAQATIRLFWIICSRGWLRRMAEARNGEKKEEHEIQCNVSVFRVAFFIWRAKKKKKEKQKTWVENVVHTLFPAERRCYQITYERTTETVLHPTRNHQAELQWRAFHMLSTQLSHWIAARRQSDSRWLDTGADDERSDMASSCECHRGVGNVAISDLAY